MKKILITSALIIIFSLQTIAQSAETGKSREIWLTTTSLSGSIGFQYKCGLNDNTFLRFSMLDLGLNQTNSLPPNTNQYPVHRWDGNTQLQVGIEKRKSVTEKTSLVYGLDLVERFAFQRSTYDNPNLTEAERTFLNYTNRAGVGIPLGVLVHLKGRLFFAAELEPAVLHYYSITGKQQDTYDDKDTGVNINMDLASAKISVVFKL